MNEELKKYLDKIATYLAKGERWHKKVANELRTIPNKRGYARIHDGQTEHDGLEAVKLDKIFRDHLKYSPNIDMSFVAKAETYTIPDFEAFKKHFLIWMEREKAFKEVVNKAIDLIRSEDTELYSMFICMAKDLKIEHMRAEWIYASLAYVDWNKPHCAVVSKWLHDQAEEPPRDWNFNIG